MTLYNQEEIDRITKVKETNDKMEEFFNDKRSDWNKSVEPLFKVLSTDVTNPSNSALSTKYIQSKLSPL